MKSDVTIAKNYLDEKQIRRLERAVSGYFDYIEDLIEDFVSSVNEFLAFRRLDTLHGKGKVSKKEAQERLRRADGFVRSAIKNIHLKP